jgi:hypothetical protein
MEYEPPSNHSDVRSADHEHEIPVAGLQHAAPSGETQRNGECELRLKLVYDSGCVGNSGVDQTRL